MAIVLGGKTEFQFTPGRAAFSVNPVTVMAYKVLTSLARTPEAGAWQGIGISDDTPAAIRTSHSAPACPQPVFRGSQ